MNRDDQAEFEKLGQSHKNDKIDFDDYKREWVSLRTVVTPPQPLLEPVAKAKGKAKAKAKAVGHGIGFLQLQNIPPGELAQHQVSHLNPVGGSIWRAIKHQSWMSHQHPWPRFSASWSLYGHRESALMCLRDNWRKFLTTAGQPLSQCPIVGLFAGVDVLPQPAAAAAAAASGA